MNKIKQLFIFFFCLIIGSLNAQYKTSIKVGASQVKEYISLLEGKNIALIGNQTSMIGSTHLVDTLLSLKVNVTKVFAPEHGFRGDADAGEKIEDGKDSKTGLPILSLYGKSNRKPSPETLKDINIIIFDIQDVGARFYTYISTMHYVMEACAEQHIKFIVLDRPNPNGHYVDGPVLKEGISSFVGMHPVPIVHGMTIGEYAQMINNEGWLANKVHCDLTVIKCVDYSHKDFYKLPIPPSPNLPNMASIYLYPSLCLFEGTNVSVGRGTDNPFQIIGSPFIEKTNYSFTPKSTFGSKHPKHENNLCYGYNLEDFGTNFFRNYKKLYLHWIVSFYESTPNKDEFFNKNGFFDLLTGDKEIIQKIKNGSSSNDIWKYFQPEVVEFKKIRKKYLLYSDFE